ncbi:uncharacterized protein MONBRDRAFT_12138 [Monosiga brevicollis MX1]|uniref:Potassium channel tetramerisation-type BTB domain-containing protein n=1 Tax=Monosiga brevicollis TaxID=81824 RepID=A9VBC1_MONBE|nr:uncharacterized protein MONBRDRAFT_12138 [Monosiga brevicollis MX1]EDQ85162.1 predicted protein [Monosiga brevicollis MX1]|eukprot:XP_001749987.1 hypothetical protein [Monosiga brevicollis MX1]
MLMATLRLNPGHALHYRMPGLGQFGVTHAESRENEPPHVFIDRDGAQFPAILQFLRAGSVPLNAQTASMVPLFLEADYFGLENMKAVLSAFYPGLARWATQGRDQHLDGLDLTLLTLAGLTLTNVVSLRNCLLDGVDMQDATLLSTDLSSSHMLKTRLSGITLRSAILSDAIIQDVSFEGGLLDRISFDRATLENCEFLGMRGMTRVTMSKARLKRCRFDCVSAVGLQYVTAEDCDLRSLALRAPLVLGAYFVRCQLPSCLTDCTDRFTADDCTFGPPDAEVAAEAAEVA